jgi:hypothetical protein
VFETDEEKRKRIVKNGAVIIILLVVAVSATIMIKSSLFLWDRLKPLPNIPECEEKGYEAGIYREDRPFCYNSCGSNNIKSCSQMVILA